MTRFLRFAAMLVLVAVSACGRQERPAQHAASSTAAPMQAAIAGAVAPGERVTFTTADGVVIVGTLYPAAASSPAVLCLHEWRADKSVFTALAQEMQKSGVTVLAIDARGYGESVKRKDGSRVEPDRSTLGDIDAALQFLRAQKSVDAKRIGILGASYGSSNALMYAAEHADIKAVALLSPGLNYHSVLPTEPAMKKYAGRPALAVAGSEDMRSVEAVTRYKQLASSGLVTALYDNGGHGVELTRTHRECTALILDFFRKNL